MQAEPHTQGSISLHGAQSTRNEALRITIVCRNINCLLLETAARRKSCYLVLGAPPLTSWAAQQRSKA